MFTGSGRAQGAVLRFRLRTSAARGGWAVGEQVRAGQQPASAGLTGNRPPVGVPAERGVPRFRGLIPAAGRVLRPAEAFLRALAADGDDVPPWEVGQVRCLGVAENRRGRGRGARRRYVVPRLDAKATGGGFVSKRRGAAGERRRARASVRLLTLSNSDSMRSAGDIEFQSLADASPTKRRLATTLMGRGLGIAARDALLCGRKVRCEMNRNRGLESVLGW